MVDSVELELQTLAEVGLWHLAPSHLLGYFKDELNDRLVPFMVSELDSVIKAIEANKSLQILSLNESKPKSENEFLSNCQSLMVELSGCLFELFTKYSRELNGMLNLFEKQQEKSSSDGKGQFASRSELLLFQKAVLVQSLSNQHFDLFDTLFRNVFDFYQKTFDSEEEENSAENDEEIKSEESVLQKEQKRLSQVLLANFQEINKIL